MEKEQGIKKKKVTKTLTSINLFLLRRTHGTKLANGTRQTAMWSSSTFKHLFQHDTKSLYPGVEKNRCQKSSVKSSQLVSPQSVMQITCRPHDSSAVQRD